MTEINPYHNLTENLPLFIPLDSSRHGRTYSYLTVEAGLEDRLNAKLQALNGNAEEMLAAAYMALLYRLSGETDIMAEWMTTGGKAVPLLLSFEQKQTFASLKKTISEQAAAGAVTAPELQFDTRFSCGQPVSTVQELLNWQVLHEEDRWMLRVDYDSSVLHEGTIRRYMLYYYALLETALADAGSLIASVDILTEADRAVYDLMNDTAFPYDTTKTIHGMFEQAAAAYPDRIALSSVHGRLTYRELNELANSTARMLLNRGLQKGEFVTIFMERSLELIVSLLGILKAGGVYVPVDPEHPEDRNRYILSDTASAYILTKTAYEAQAALLCEGVSTVKEIIAMDSGMTEVYEGVCNVEIGITPQDLAYIIYTSGSTGRPKGALIAHEGVVNLGETVRTDCQIGPEDVLTQFATYSFDASVWDTVGALFYGAHLYLLSPDERVSVEEFASAIERTGTTIITILPTVFFNQLSAYLSEEGYRKLSGVKLITVAGEALYGEQVRAFQRKFQDAIDIVNVYGPTECTVCTTTFTVKGFIPDDLTNVPIGKPIHNYKVYIVNEENQLCPVNVHGEVYISTVGLAKGYLNQPEKTAEAFIENPFGEGKIYKSGDIAKLLPDGTVEYVGRRDSQIKIRGHRIEIGEIEDSFAKIPDVQDVAVICKKDTDGQNMLVGYFTTKDGGQLPSAVIKRMLGTKLPSYFVPKWIVQLNVIPTSPTGKIDRKGLQRYNHMETAVADEGFVMPATDIERNVAAAWQEALRLEQVGRYDDFFSIGGDSLAIIHVLVLLKPEYPELKINDFFQCRTVEALSARIEQLQAEQPQAEERSAKLSGPAVPLNEEPPIPLLGGAQDESRGKPNAIFLTGATGYLGAYLLYELLEQSAATVYCLVRPGIDSGLVRIQAHMEYFFGSSVKELVKDRVIAVEGDLEQENLGIVPEVRQKLLGTLDAIIHSAADVRHFGEEEQFAKTNIAGTLALIDLAKACVKPARFHHVSTLGIPEDLALSGQWEEVVREQALRPDLKVENLYTNSKMEAEKALMSAAGEGLQVNIYRAGNLSSHSGSGLFQRNIDSNSFYRMLKAMLLLGKAPKVQWEVDFTPIDYAGKAIASLALQPDRAGRLYHICNPQTLTYAKWIDLIRSYGYQVDLLEPEAYTAWLFDASIPKNAEGVKLAIAQLEGDGAKDSGYRYGCESTYAALQAIGVTCAAPDHRFMGNMMDHAVKIGYFPKALVTV
ncbi:amino acid adenylation domain-containing protein [Paenibacillus glycanilyticus]|uniref:non-ribosomal peptide synthetase family protein n=1 Tax=Paenibacillus glycanilyticus TaxID=126569 RepID=UPI00203AFE99|nr:non-ribosomal peptide synthetase [Paenibacillus glycanilyticus]MCM3631097.1 amino acid adenylation domain-containing protein [Paenibacillus glycanilyticus]